MLLSIFFFTVANFACLNNKGQWISRKISCHIYSLRCTQKLSFQAGSWSHQTVRNVLTIGPSKDDPVRFQVPYIFESNPHLNLIRTSFFADFLNEKILVRGCNPHLSFNRPLPTRQTDWIILDVTNALTVIRLTRSVWNDHFTASGTNAPQLISVAVI